MEVESRHIQLVAENKLVVSGKNFTVTGGILIHWEGCCFLGERSLKFFCSESPHIITTIQLLKPPGSAAGDQVGSGQDLQEEVPYRYFGKKILRESPSLKFSHSQFFLAKALLDCKTTSDGRRNVCL